MPNIKGSKIADFAIYGKFMNNSSMFRTHQTFDENHPVNNRLNSTTAPDPASSSAWGKTLKHQPSQRDHLILLTASVDGFVCPYLITYKKENLDEIELAGGGARGMNNNSNNGGRGPNDQYIKRYVADFGAAAAKKIDPGLVNKMKRLKSPKVDLDDREELVKLGVCTSHKYVLVSSARRGGASREASLEEAKQYRLFLFKISVKDMLLQFQGYLDLSKESYARLPGSFFQTLVMDFKQHSKQPYAYVIAFPYSGGFEMVIFRVKEGLEQGGRGRLEAQLPSSFFNSGPKGLGVSGEDGSDRIEGVGVVHNYHTGPVLGGVTVGGELWSLDFKGLLNYLNWNLV